jgi:hypothetical protein
MKYFRMSYDEVVFKRSYLNLLLLNAAIPSIKPYNEYNENSDTLDYSPTHKTKTRDYSLNDNGNSFLTSLM